MDRFEEDEPHGYVTRELDDSIKSYQRDSGLKEDGILHPGGETETAIIEDMGRDAGDGTPPIPERKPDSDDVKESSGSKGQQEASCTALADRLRMARIRRDGFDQDLTRLLEQKNSALDAWRKAEEELARVEAEATMKTGLSGGKGVLGAASFVSTYVAESQMVNAARQKAEQARQKFEAIESEVEYLRKQMGLLSDEIENIQMEISEAGC